ncbi:MAG: hypothetical protein M1347_02345 [Chloroflexi bacterium]|nr:hypothetical protein [Chloroflexota bacterium]
MRNPVVRLYQTKKTVVTLKDLALIWQETNYDHLKAKAAYYAKRGILIRLSRSIFALGKDYNPRELATSIYAPSYISFETVLREAGMIFQHYETIFVAAKRSAALQVDGHKFTFRKLKDVVLFNPAGTLFKENYSIAEPERAFLDMIYLFPTYYFDNLSPVDWTKCKQLISIYKNKQLLKRLIGYQKEYAE